MVNIANYKDLVIGSRVIEPGNSENFNTGDWRSMVPVVDSSLCIDCLTCWIYCPDDCVLVENDRVVGICSKVCPKKAITMKEDIQ